MGGGSCQSGTSPLRLGILFTEVLGNSLDIQTAPVGRYQRDISPYGVMDMAGNVEEWVSTEMRDNEGLGLTK